MDDEEFFRWYGDWDSLDPRGLAEVMAGFDRPWWIVGGWAIEAFTGVPREHEDVDLSILTCDVPAFRAHLGADWTPWNIHDGTLRPLNDQFPDVQHPESQIWVRRSAHEPWVLDLPLTPDRGGLWTSKRDPTHVAPVDQVTWVATDGIRYLCPEIVLTYKASPLQRRPKDERDRDLVWPLLAPDRQEWLRATLDRVYPDHPWLDLY
ncbi:nucleotidyltransferase domain-containing protein [Nocardioides bigeumensis]|uniref:Amino acid transporter n=1 Tax=Nocardioides bigeumensis TaxID=433657 RepID=A0ABP5JDK6_9ACTN